jgi:hypothetical protein
MYKFFILQLNFLLMIKKINNTHTFFFGVEKKMLDSETPHEI